MEFYDGSWQFLGSKCTAAKTHRPFSADTDPAPSGPNFFFVLTQCSGVPTAILEGQDLTVISVAQRMSWAAKRQTTRQEDMAYCLMDLFDIHMPLLYGEGRRNAFIRLQEEIVKRTDDESLFAWRLPDKRITLELEDSSVPFSGLLAPSPACFSDGGNIVSDSWRSVLPNIPTNMTNRGLQMEAKLA